MRRLRVRSSSRPTKFDLAKAEVMQTIPCPDCGRDLRVPAQSVQAKAHGASCICGASYRVTIPALGADHSAACERVSINS